MKQNQIALCALVSILAGGAFVGCGGDDMDPDGSGGDSGSSATAGASNSGGRSGVAGSGDGATNGESGAGGDGGAGGAPVVGPACEEIATLCDPHDLGPGPQRDCNDLSRGGDEELCGTELDGCRDACENATELPFALTFGAKVGSETFHCGSTYTGLGADNSTVHPQDFKFYVHDIRFIDDAGDEVPVELTQDGVWQVEGVALLDFEDKTGNCSNGTVELNDTVVGTVPFGAYRGIAYKLGVPFELNHTDVASAPSPLNLSSLFWSWNMGHLFLSIMNSTERDNGARFGTLIHLGSMACTGDPAIEGVQSCAKPNRPEYSFPMFRPGRNIAVADMKEVLQKSNLKIDQCHSFEDACAGPFEELGVDWTTGAPTSTQTIFRME